MSAFVIWLALAAPALAQERPPRPEQVRAGPARIEPGIGLRVYVLFDRVNLAASDTFDAVTGSSSMTAVGGGVDLRVWKGLFGRVAISSMDADGTRGFVVQGRFVSNGIPQTIEMTPIEIAGGWRFVLDRQVRYVAYGGGGLLRMKYRQTSEFALPGEDIDTTENGYLAFGGLDVRLWRWISAGVEAQYRTVPDALGSDGVAAAFDESDLGGTAIRVLVGIGR